ncbi:type VII secretion protein EssA [Alkalihalobacterium chitinilyticum]|uniref:Type VII secretion protein EssA n=1 Tax=Alkalihalobacterium chitinilyticum TaxID=2980103 RepID=A0ABT5VID9_9BACI|nr:type VII secretion protein EssA [Alkalihalobacterium chitinilyticum]MDE5415221.1 type VII secretion protein EssA [Alkalihalobacterium chitinilyticum]
MKRFLKLVNGVFCILIVSLLLPMFAVLAEGQPSTEERGKLNMNLDRIIGSKEDQTKTKTELEKVFPELFRDETRELIDRKQLKQEEWLQDLHQSIFEMESQADATVALVQETLFTASYTTPTTENRVHEEPSEGANNVLLFSFVGFILMVGGVVFTMMRQVVE